MSSVFQKLRYRFQFRLRTLFVVMTVLAIPCAWVGWQAKTVRARRAMLDQVLLEYNGGSSVWPYDWPNPPKDRNGVVISIPWIRRLLGDVTVTAIELPPDTSIEERRRVHAFFPEATMIGVVWERTKNRSVEHLVPFSDETEIGETSY